MVPSSTAFTQSAAIFWPSLPQTTELSRPTLVASRECPQASWKMTPPKPFSMTTGMAPAGQGRAWSMVRADFAALRPR